MSGENIEWNYRSVYTQKKKHNTTKKTTNQTLWQTLPLAYYNYYLLKFEDLRHVLCACPLQKKLS